jgi:hypothetical protein
VLVRTGDTALRGPDGAELPILAGMTASVELLSGRKTVLQYLLKPLTRASQGLRNADCTARGSDTADRGRRARRPLAARRGASRRRIGAARGRLRTIAQP